MKPLTCPDCGGECERDMVDVGVGSVPAGPWCCPDCHWVERDEPREADGEAFRGGEAAAYEREQQTEAQKLK